MFPQHSNMRSEVFAKFLEISGNFLASPQNNFATPQIVQASIRNFMKNFQSFLCGSRLVGNILNFSDKLSELSVLNYLASSQNFCKEVFRALRQIPKTSLNVPRTFRPIPNNSYKSSAWSQNFLTNS